MTATQYHMDERLRLDITQRLRDDMQFEVRGDRGEYLRKGKCPQCGKREVFTSAEAPWMLKCGRENKCGWQEHIKEVFPDLFSSWTERYGNPAPKPADKDGKPAPVSKTPVADAYLSIGRGFDLEKIAGWYAQEQYWDPRIEQGSATVRFAIADGYWERLIDKPERFGKKKAHVRGGWAYKGMWWAPPGMDLCTTTELWVTEGIFDAIALIHAGKVAVSSIGVSNFPDEALAWLADQCQSRGLPRPKIIWAYDGDPAGAKYTRSHTRKAEEAGWDCSAAIVPFRKGKKRDWNEAWQRGELTTKHLEDYRYHGALLLAKRPADKASLMYHRTGLRQFWFTHWNRTYWCKLDVERFEKARRELGYDGEDSGEPNPLEKQEIFERARMIQEIANCEPRALYYLANAITDEAWYYFHIAFPHDGPTIKANFTAAQLTASSEFKRRLMHVAPGGIWEGSSDQLTRLLKDQTEGIKQVQTIDFIGYAREFSAWIFGDLCVYGGKVYRANEEDYFDLGRTAIKTLAQSPALNINDDREAYTSRWAQTLWQAYGAKGVVCLAFWVGSLFAEQIRDAQKSLPFLELVGEAGSGKSTLIEFLWKLLGRRDYEGFDPSKATLAARARNFAQVAGMPVVLIESERDQDAATKQRQFDWEELKTAYNGRSVRSRGHKNGGNDTYEPPFRASLVISQNAAVSGSDAIMQRIVHVQMGRDSHTDQTRALAESLERTPIEQVSGFALACAVREPQVMEVMSQRTAGHEQYLREVGVRVHRIAKNHAQLMSLVRCLGQECLGLLPDNAINEALNECERMALERQEAINADHPVVAEFWDAVDYLRGLGAEEAWVNHYREDSGQIAINLKHFEALCAEHKIRAPATVELKRHLRASKRRRFVEANRVVRSLIWERTTRCWVFEDGEREND
jgi:hypothetical protein